MSSLGDGTDARLGEIAGQAGRFLIVGVANTLATGAVFYVLGLALAAWLAYTVAFGLGLAFTVAVTPRLVFMVRPPIARRAAYAGWYLVVYAVGLVLVQLLDTVVRAGHTEIVLATVATTALLSFLGGRAILTAR